MEAAHQIFDGGMASLIDALHELEDKMGVCIDERDPDVVVMFVLESSQGRIRADCGV